MNLTQNRPTALTNPTDPVINSSFYDQASRAYNTRKAFIGDQIELKYCYAGILVEFPDGRRGVTQSRYARYVLVRMDDSGLAEQMNPDVQVTLIDRIAGWGLPPVGSFVKVLKGQRQGEIGMVISPGVNSTHVLFGFGTGDTSAVSNTRMGKHHIKYPAKNLMIVNAEITLD